MPQNATIRTRCLWSFLTLTAGLVSTVYGVEGLADAFDSADTAGAQTVPAQVLLYQLRTAGLVDDKVEDSAQQEELVRVMLAVANRFAPLAERQGQRFDFDVAADGDSEMSVAFSAGAAVGSRGSVSPTCTGTGGGGFQNPIRDSVDSSDGQTDSAAEAVGYYAYRAMMMAIADPSVSAVNAARLNDLGEKIRLVEQAAAAADEGDGALKPQRSRAATSM